MAPMQIPRRYSDYWAHPWRRRAKYSPGFRLLLHRHGLLSPHFSYQEAACKDAACTPIPRRLRTGARNHAFNLERLRHALGDVAIPITSWYRTPAHNREVNGAGNSLHMKAIATDIPVEFVEQHPGFDVAANRIFSKGGFGQYPGGARHVDSRGVRARWSSWTPGR